MLVASPCPDSQQLSLMAVSAANMLHMHVRFRAVQDSVTKYSFDSTLPCICVQPIVAFTTSPPDFEQLLTECADKPIPRTCPVYFTTHCRARPQSTTQDSTAAAQCVTSQHQYLLLRYDALVLHLNATCRAVYTGDATSLQAATAQLTPDSIAVQLVAHTSATHCTETVAHLVAEGNSEEAVGKPIAAKTALPVLCPPHHSSILVAHGTCRQHISKSRDCSCF